MSADLAYLTGLAEAAFAAGFVVFLRVGAVMALLPAFGERSLPARVRLAAALAFTMVVAPAVAPLLPPVPRDAPGLLGLAAAEVLAGLLLGLGMRLFLLALQTAGAIAAQATSLSQIFGGSAGVDPQPAVAHLLTVSALALAATAGLHVKAALALVGSYEVLPPGSLPAASAVADWGTGLVAATFALAFTLAAPFLAAALLYNVALGVINRAMPQLMVSFVGAPALTFGGLILMLLALPPMLGLWLAAFDGFLADPLGAPP